MGGWLGIYCLATVQQPFDDLVFYTEEEAGAWQYLNDDGTDLLI